VGEQDEEQRKARTKVVKIGIEPHYSFANMLCDVAWVRSHGNRFMILPDRPAAAAPFDSDDRVLPMGDNQLTIGPWAESHNGAAGAGVGIIRSGCGKCLGKKYTESSGQRSPGRATC